MSGNGPEKIDPVERVLDMIREYYADPEVMAALGSADAEGQIPDEAAKIIGDFKRRWHGDNETARLGPPAAFGP